MRQFPLFLETKNLMFGLEQTKTSLPFQKCRLIWYSKHDRDKKAVQTRGRGGMGKLWGLLASIQWICPDICIHELTEGFSDKHACLFIVNLENLTLATHV